MLSCASSSAFEQQMEKGPLLLRSCCGASGPRRCSRVRPAQPSSNKWRKVRCFCDPVVAPLVHVDALVCVQLSLRATNGERSAASAILLWRLWSTSMLSCASSSAFEQQMEKGPLLL